MIPRTKVNYGWTDLWQAIWTTDRKHTGRNLLKTQLSDHLGGNRTVWLTASGRASLKIILEAADRPYVLAPAYTCKAVAEAIRFAGKTAVWVEMEPTGFNMSGEATGERLSQLPAGSAVLLVTHQYGMACDILPMLDAARRHDALVIEDAAGALGCEVAGQPAGSWSDAAVFSFDSTKLLHAPLKAGALAVRDPKLASRVQSVIQSQPSTGTAWGKSKTLILSAILLAIEHPWLYSVFHYFLFQRRKRFMLDSPGMQTALDGRYDAYCSEWQAAIVAKQMTRLDDYVAVRRQMYEEYSAALRGCPGFEAPITALTSNQPAGPVNRWACVRFPILVEGDKEAFYQRCISRGVDLAFSFTHLAEPGTNVRADEIARRVVNPPFYQKLSASERRRVVEALAFAGRGDENGEDSRTSQYGSQPHAKKELVLKR